MSDPWNPSQYERFRDERARPFRDLLALVQPRPGMKIIDLGCGTGETTRALHLALGARETVGLDNSPAMLAAAGKHGAEGLRFEQGDLGRLDAQARYDLVFSNAALHWTADHPALLGRLGAALLPGGQLAVQVPRNERHPSHRTALEVAREPAFRELLGGFERHSPVLEPVEYAALLHRLGFVEQHVRLQVYAHLLPSRDDVVEWVKGTLLTDYQRRLPDEAWPRFLARYRDRLLPQLDATRPFLFTYERVLFWGRRA